MAHPQEDNVTYVNFGARKRVSSAEEASAPVVRTLSTRGNAAAQILLRAVQQGADQGRYSRGRSYADQGNVLEVRPESGRFAGTVAGSQNEPFEVMVILPYRDTRDISAALESLARDANAFADARAGQLREELVHDLFCGERERIRFACNCPDNTPVCKHAVAVTIKAAELIDANPTLIFRLRNLDLHTLEQQIRASAGRRAQESAAEGSEFFWSGHPLPKLPEPKVAPMIEDSDMELLHKAMQSISFTNIDQLRAVSDLEDLYHELSRET